jgi:hypothetical protein
MAVGQCRCGLAAAGCRFVALVGACCPAQLSPSGAQCAGRKCASTDANIDPRRKCTPPNTRACSGPSDARTRPAHAAPEPCSGEIGDCVCSDNDRNRNNPYQANTSGNCRPHGGSQHGNPSAFPSGFCQPQTRPSTQRQ